MFIDGKKAATLRGPTLTADFKQMVTDYIERRFGQFKDLASARRSNCLLQPPAFIAVAAGA